jgi:hypothetical protein
MVLAPLDAGLVPCVGSAPRPAPPRSAALDGAVLLASVVLLAEVEQPAAPPTAQLQERGGVAPRDNGLVTTEPKRITAEHLVGLPGLRRRARDALLAAQPRTVGEALRLPDVGRKTTRQLLALGLLTDEEQVQ